MCWTYSKCLKTDKKNMVFRGELIELKTKKSDFNLPPECIIHPRPTKTAKTEASANVSCFPKINFMLHKESMDKYRHQECK